MRYVALIVVSTGLWAQERAAIGNSNLQAREKEAALGASLAAEYRKRAGVIDNEPARVYLAALTAQLRTKLPEGAPNFRVAVSAREPHGRIRFPVAIPGGHIFVPARMLADAPDEAGFARQLAHAMAHVAERHGFRESARSRVENREGVPLIFLGGWAACDRTALIPQAVKAYQRQYELEAEALANRWMANFVPDVRFAAVQAELRALEPPQAPPTLRRPGELRAQ